jgi:hypothetical protein
MEKQPCLVFIMAVALAYAGAADAVTGDPYT